MPDAPRDYWQDAPSPGAGGSAGGKSGAGKDQTTKQL